MHSLLRWLLPSHDIRPVFIIGCGRSGTTILGETLSRHPSITYLQEPRQLWFSVFPETDIWSEDASRREAKLVLTETDADPRRAKKLRRLFARESARTGRPVVVEKLPINNFRLEFIDRIFPEARFVHIHRNGLEVARSMAKLSEAGRWFKLTPYRWQKLVEHARSRPETRHLPELCTSYCEMGMLEWRLSVGAAMDFLRRLPEDRFIETGYQAMVDRPAETLGRILQFLDLPEDPAVMQFAAENIRRKSQRIEADAVSENTHVLGGDLLKLSMTAPDSLTAHSKGRARVRAEGADKNLGLLQPQSAR